MRKLTLLILFFVSISIFSQTVYVNPKTNHNLTEDIPDNRTSGDYLKTASRDFLIGTSLGFLGGALAISTALNQSKEDSQMMNLAMYGLSGAMAIAGTILVIKGYIDIGKAGTKLNYEIKANELKLSVML